ncbi:hypothetical protein [Saccharothrix sp.]|uniref:hypothetical protein n=1 Tax=Saccharothrix sp. TaxID=1873460 RepID=UPI0028112F7F|nr:hypothetical protein [Saccharothrix sp.]
MIADLRLEVDEAWRPGAVRGTVLNIDDDRGKNDHGRAGEQPPPISNTTKIDHVT